MNRQQRYENKQFDSGLVRVHLWVPQTEVDRIKKYAERLRAQCSKKTLKRT